MTDNAGRLQARRDGSTADDPFAWESREFLRKLSIGQVCLSCPAKLTSFSSLILKLLPVALHLQGRLYLGKHPGQRVWLRCLDRNKRQSGLISGV